MQGQYNLRSPAVKRLMKEAQELKDPTELYHAQPLEDNLFEWHFTLRGPEESDFDGGVYHGRIILPPEYPMKPPSIILLTPNGRFETFKKICLSISGHHPESWQPSWSIRTALLAIIGFMPTHGGGAIGSLDYTPEERKVLAKKSQDWKCPECGDVSQQLKPKTEASEKASQEAKELASQINFQGEKPGETPTKTSEGNACTTSITTSATSGQPTPVFASTPSPAQPSFSYPWAMPPGWGTLPQQNPGVPRPLAFARFPYPPPMMLPPPGMFMPPAPSSYGQRLPGFPPVPFFQPGVRGLPQAQGASGVVTEGTLPQMAGAAAVSSSPANQQQGSAPSNPASSSVTPMSSSPTVATQPTTAASTAAPSSSAAQPAPASAETVGAASHTQVTTTSSDSTATPAQSTSTSASPSTDTPALASTTSPSTDTTDLANTTTTAPSTELRQRTGAATTTTQPHTPSGTPATSDAPAAQSQGSYSRGTIVMIVILSMAITLLLGRRMYMLYFGRGFQGYFD